MSLALLLQAYYSYFSGVIIICATCIYIIYDKALHCMHVSACAHC